MFNFLDKLRKKPDRLKKQMAFFTAFSLAGVVFVVWLSVIYPDFINTQEQEKKVSDLEANPLNNFTQTFLQGISGMKDQFKNLKDSISSFSTSPTYYSATSSNATSSTQSQAKSQNTATTTPQ